MNKNKMHFHIVSITQFALCKFQIIYLQIHNQLEEFFRLRISESSIGKVGFLLCFKGFI